MSKENQKWLVLDAGGGWQIVIPDTDILPHADVTAEQAEKLKATGSAELEVAGMTCPCKPKVDVGSRLIIHNSFEDQVRINEAMDNPHISPNSQTP
jgi:hypothetical protein